MGKIYSEKDITWSSVEKYYPYNKTIWKMDKNGIPRFTLLDKNEFKINIGE